MIFQSGFPVLFIIKNMDQYFFLFLLIFFIYYYYYLSFSLNTALKVDNCEYKEPPISCPSLPPGSVPHSYHRPSEHLPIAEVHPSFRIPIGLYLRSSYIFRILAKERNVETVRIIHQIYL